MTEHAGPETTGAEPAARQLPAVLDVDERDLTGHRNFVFTPTGLRVMDVPDFDQCAIFAMRLARLANAYQFAVGDLILYLEQRFGEKASQIVDRETFPGAAESSIKVYRWVASQIAAEDRRPSLTFKHHQLVAALNPADQRDWLDRAENGGDPWPTSRLAAAIRENDPSEVKAVWALVKCKDLADFDEFRAKAEGDGRFVKLHEQRERPKKVVTAKAKRTKKRGKSRG